MLPIRRTVIGSTYFISQLGIASGGHRASNAKCSLWDFSRRPLVVGNSAAVWSCRVNRAEIEPDGLIDVCGGTAYTQDVESFCSLVLSVRLNSAPGAIIPSHDGLWHFVACAFGTRSIQLTAPKRHADCCASCNASNTDQRNH